MKKEVEDALKNIDWAVSQVALNREQHVILIKNIELIKAELTSNVKEEANEPK